MSFMNERVYVLLVTLIICIFVSFLMLCAIGQILLSMFFPFSFSLRSSSRIRTFFVCVQNPLSLFPVHACIMPIHPKGPKTPFRFPVTFEFDRFLLHLQNSLLPRSRITQPLCLVSEVTINPPYWNSHTRPTFSSAVFSPQQVAYAHSPRFECTTLRGQGPQTC